MTPPVTAAPSSPWQPDRQEVDRGSLSRALHPQRPGSRAALGAGMVVVEELEPIIENEMKTLSDLIQGAVFFAIAKKPNQFPLHLIRPDSDFKKSARIVGEVLGKYHPHGDQAVYFAMARMAQDFSMRAMLVDGQGNFGSMDGDSPAAMRYTEARLSLLASHMLSDLEKDTVNFVENFDGTLTEPNVLPAAFPNMLVNGATGIAVGMATSIPPHNLGEVIDALNYLLGKWTKLDDISVEDLMGFIQGPDFPTGGMIIQDTDGDSLVSSYGTGRGKVIVQARAHLEEMSRGRNRIIITELPYMTNKSTLIERIATLVREEKIEGIADLRDESDHENPTRLVLVPRSKAPLLWE